MSDPHETAERIVFGFCLDHDVSVKPVEGRGPGDKRPLIEQIEQALTQAHEEERNALADKLEEMAIATYGKKIVEPIPVSSDILWAWVEPLRSGERAYGSSTCFICHHQISYYCKTCFEKVHKEGRKEMMEEVINIICDFPVRIDHALKRGDNMRCWQNEIAQKIKELK